MKFYSRKTPRAKAEALVGQIGTGKCNDKVVSDLKGIMAELADPTDRERVLAALREIVMESGNRPAVGYALKALLALRPLADGAEGELELRAKELIADLGTFTDRALQEAIAELLYLRTSERVDRAAPFTGALIRILDERAGTGGSTAYNTLMIVAANRPDFFQQNAGQLVRMLGSINRATRLQTTRLIAVLAMSHPEYVAGAEQTLQSISSFNPDGELKNSASEALQILSSQLRPDERTPIDDMIRRPEQEPREGLAEIMRRRAGGDKKVSAESRIDKRLLSMATNFARKADRAYQPEVEAAETEKDTIGKIVDDFSEIAASIKAEAVPVEAPKPVVAEAAPAEVPKPAAVEAAPPAAPEPAEEVELKRMMEKVKDDFSINAGSILDAIGMGHLAKKETDEVKPWPAEAPARDRPKRAPLTIARHIRLDQTREKLAKEARQEKEARSRDFIASIENILNQNDKEPAGIPAGEPAAADESGITAAGAGISPDTKPPEPVAPSGSAPSELPPEPRHEPPKTVKPPIVPSGVRITAMKFKSVDQSKAKKTPVPPKISIKPHIKPLSKTPIDSVKSGQPRQQPASDAPHAPEPGPEASQGFIFCHSCNAKMPEDSQRCAICGSDLKAPKVRCRTCGEINPRGAGKCSRCNSLMDE